MTSLGHNELSLNRYLQAYFGNTGKCPSKLTAYVYCTGLMLYSKKMYYVHICTCLWIFTLYCSMLWVLCVCLCIHACLRAHAYAKLYQPNVLPPVCFPCVDYSYVHLLNKWFLILISDTLQECHMSVMAYQIIGNSIVCSTAHSV